MESRRNIEADWKTVEQAASTEEESRNRNVLQSLDAQMTKKMEELEQFLQNLPDKPDIDTHARVRKQLVKPLKKARKWIKGLFTAK